MNPANKSYVVAVDGSLHGDLAFDYAVRHTKPEDTIHVVNVARFLDSGKMTDTLLKEENEKLRKQAAEIMNRYDAMCKQQKRKCVLSILPYQFGGTSVVGDEICKMAEKLNAKGIFVGSRGLSNIKRMVIGSVSEYCVRNCQCTVSVVKD